MKKNFTFKNVLFYLVLIIGVVFLIKNLDNTKPNKENTLSEKYNNFLENHPFRKTMKLSKEERLSKGLPPNKYFEQEWLYTSDPALLRPAPEKVHQLQKELATNSGMKAAVGDPTNSWVERGPNNVGGRTHTLMFAPGSTIKVFAGGVSGGLWVNNDITSAASVWQQVNGVPGNMAVMCITVDPNDSNTMYIGTGEVYTWGAVNGNGIYKSTDGGNNWVNIYSGGANIADKITYVQDIIAWNNPVTNQTEIFFGADAMAYTEEVESGSAGAGWSWLGSNTIGLYRSTDGTNFNRLTGALYESSAGKYYAPNSFDVGADGKLWMGTKYSYFTGEGGGRVFSNDGNNWTNVINLGTNGRVEIACSQQSAGKIYALAEDRVDGTNPVKIYRTTNSFTTPPTSLAQPNDADTNISALDFTRGQSFYDLMIGLDPNNDATLYVGGIDLFKSTNSGGSWSQFSHWYGGFGYQEVHADQHGIAFSSSNRIIFGNDGGVYYTNNGGTSTVARNNGYNVTQFYKAAINQSVLTDKLLAGAQDNGSQFADNAVPGVNSTVEVTGGDGCWAFIDKDNQFMISSYVYNNYRYLEMDGTYVGNFPSATNDGDFVNQCGFDSASNILYSNGTDGTTYRIYRWAINPAGPTFTKTTLSNAMLNTVPTYFTASPFVNNRILVGTALGKIIRLDNANGTPIWTDISMPGQVGAVSDIRYGQTENDILVSFHNYGVTSIWYTNDGGANWVSKEGDLPDMPVKCILQNPLSLNEVIIGTELGVWQTSNWDDANPNWTQSYSGMSDVKVLSFDFRSADNTIIAATFGRGMFTGTFEGIPIPVTCTNTINSLAYNESFESGIGLWSQALGDDGDWIEFSGSTPSSGTGPSSASNGSTYLYIEASSNSTPGEIGANATAVLDGPCLDLTTLLNVQFEFDYHTFGADIGSITVQGSINEGNWFNLFTTPGVSADAWITETIDLSAYSDIMKIRIVGLTGNGWSSDLAIDNINIFESCTGSVTYNGSWSPASPSISTAVTINSNYSTLTNGGSIEACEITISNNSTLTITAGDYLKVNGNIIVDTGSSLIIQHEASLVQVDDNATVTNNGTINVIKTTPVATGNSFSILGSPMSGTTRGGAFGANNVVMYHQTAQFNLDPDVTDVNSGAEHFADVEGDNWQFISNGTTNVFAPEGYLVGPTTASVGSGSYDLTYNEGTLNNGIYSFNTIYNPGATPAERKSNSPNILSNPYASAIDADALITNNAVIDEIYFWEHLTAPSAGYPGYRFENWNMGDISIRNMGGSVQAPNGGVEPTQYIASGQGFGIKANAVGTVTFNNSLRVTGNNTSYRNSEIERMYLKISNETYALKSSTLVAFTNGATNGYEAMYDTKRLATPISIYSLLEERELAIQGRSVFTTDQVIPLGFRTMVEEVQTYTISLGTIEGANITEATVYLQDNLLGTVTNLSEGSYTFTSNESNQKDRFVIVFTEEQLGNNDVSLEAISLYPNPTATILNIVSPLSTINKVEVYDVQGRVIASITVANKSTYQLDMSTFNTAMYFVKVTTNDGDITKRVVKK